MNVLIIEDDPMVCEIETSYLLKIAKKFTVDKVDEVIDGLDLLVHKHYDLVLLDNYLPKHDGIYLFDLLKQNNLHPFIIMISAANDTEIVKKALEYGVVDYLIKPFKFERFKKAIEKFLYLNKIDLNKEQIQQQELNQFFHTSTSIEENNVDNKLPKGISKYSLNIIKKCISDLQKDEFNTNDIVVNSNLSRVSVKKYLDYLVSINFLDSKTKFLDIGRPVTIFVKKKSED